MDVNLTIDPSERLGVEKESLEQELTEKDELKAKTSGKKLIIEKE